MKNLTVKIFATLLAILTLTAFSSCQPKENPPVIQQGSFIQFKESELTIDLGETQQIQFFSAEKTENIEWVSSDDSIVSVINGQIIGLKAGKATVTASISEYDKAFCEVTVLAPVSKAYSMTVSREELRLSVNETFDLSCKVRYGTELIENTKIRWDSLDKTVATIDENGTITPVAYGKTVITAECVMADGTLLQKQCELIVVENYVLKISESENGLFVNPLETFTVTPVLFDENGNQVVIDKTACTYGVSNENLIEQNNGEFTALATGKTQVYVKYREIVAYCDVDVWGIKDKDFALISGIAGTCVAQTNDGILSYTSIPGVSQETTCGVFGSAWKDFCEQAIGYGYMSIVVKVYQVQGVMTLYPSGTANCLFDVNMGATLTEEDVSFEQPFVGEKLLSECKDWRGIYFGMYGSGNFIFQITLK